MLNALNQLILVNKRFHNGTSMNRYSILNSHYKSEVSMIYYNKPNKYNA